MGNLNEVVEVQATVVAAELLSVPVLPVYQVQPAAPATAGWLQHLFAPVIKACRFDGPIPPIELRPTGEWGGWAQLPSYAPDRRVSISNKVRLWSKSDAIHVVVHEWTHQLMTGYDHDAAFAAMNQVLLYRIDFANPPRQAGQALALGLSFYDLQDLPNALRAEPDAGLCSAMRWATTQARELAPSRLGAEAVAKEITKRYEAWLLELETQPAKREAAAEKQRQRLQSHQEAQRRVVALRRQVRELIWWLAATGATAVLMALGMLKLAFER
jgi:hypothetical protein